MVYHTVFASPQLELIELDDVPWIKVQQRALQRRTPRRIILGEPLTWMGLETSAFIFLSLQVLGAVGRTCFPHVSCVMCTDPVSRMPKHPLSLARLRTVPHQVSGVDQRLVRER